MTKIDSSTWYYPSSPSTTIYLQKACTVICFDSSLLIHGAEIRAPRFRPILLDVYDYPISVHIVTPALLPKFGRPPLTPARLSPASGRSSTRSRPMFQFLNTLPTHVLPVPHEATPRSPPDYEAREDRLQTASRPNSQNIPYPQGDGHNTSTESIELEIEREQLPRLVENTPTLHSTHALHRPMGLYAYNIDADFGSFPMSCCLESSIQYTRVDTGVDERNFTGIRVWYIQPPPEE